MNDNTQNERRYSSIIMENYRLPLVSFGRTSNILCILKTVAFVNNEKEI